MAWISFDALQCIKKTWWQLASRCCWNRARPWHASELVSFLVGLRTYQHPGYCCIEMGIKRMVGFSKFGMDSIWGIKCWYWSPKGYYRCRQIIATNLGKHRLTWHRSALPANPTSSRPRSWSLGNATLVVAERSGWRQVLSASKPRPSA